MGLVAREEFAKPIQLNLNHYKPPGNLRLMADRLGYLERQNTT